MFQKAVVLKLYLQKTNMLIMVTVGFKQLVEALRLDFERHFYTINLKGQFLS